MPAPYSPPQRKSRRLVITLIALILILIVVVVVGLLTRPDPAVKLIEQTVEVCNDSGFVRVADEGRTLIVSTEGEEAIGAGFDELYCVINELEVPASIINRIDTTRALDGMQFGSWDSFEASWNYHPDNGMNLVVSVAD